MIGAKQQPPVFGGAGTTFQVDIAGHYSREEEIIESPCNRVETRHTVLSAEPYLPFKIFYDRLYHIIHQPIVRIVILKRKVLVILPRGTQGKTCSCSANPHTTFTVTEDIAYFVATQFAVIKIVGVVTLGVFNQRIGMEYIDTIVCAYPHPIVFIGGDSPHLLLAVATRQEVTEDITVICRNSQVESTSESTYPHTPFKVTEDIIDMIMGQ